MDFNKFTEDLKNSLPENTTANHDNLIITPASSQTKDWRKKQPWYHGGKQNECELYQKALLEQITKQPCQKTQDRIYRITYQILPCSNPLKRNDGIYWTENFDVKQRHNDIEFNFNLKMVCDRGGAQPRTLREGVGHFIEYQLEHLLKFPNEDKYYVNILDGNTSRDFQPLFDFMLSLDKYTNVKNKVFVGDMHEFQKWFKNLPVLQTRDE
jgi:hypothetical protein